MNHPTPFDVIAQPLENATFLIEASAGTGKTYNIQHLYLRLIAESGLKAEEILVVTFTEAATAELRRRIRSNLHAAFAHFATPITDPKNPLPALIDNAVAKFGGDREAVRQRLRRAITDFDKSAIGTIHGFCKRMLAENAFESKVAFDLEFIEETDRILTEAVRNFLRIEQENDDALEVDDKLRRSLIDFARKADDPKITIEIIEDGESETALKRRLHEYLKSTGAIANYKREHRIQTFDDMIVNLHAALNNDPQSLIARAIRSKYKAALVDEFQDTDSLQYEIFHTLFGKGDTALFFMIGDPKQAIYGFRGGDIHTYLSARHDVEPSRCQTLLQNFRSSPKLLEAFETLFARVNYKGDEINPFGDPRIDYPHVTSGKGEAFDTALLCDGRPPEAPLVIHNYTATGRSPIAKGEAQPIIERSLTQEVTNFLSGRFSITKDGVSRAVRPCDIAILVSSNGEARNIQRQLKHRGVPGIVLKSGNVFRSPVAEQLLYLMESVNDPMRLAKLKTALATPLMGYTDADIARNANHDALDTFTPWMERFQQLKMRWETHGFMSAFGSFIRAKHGENGEQSIMDHLARASDAARNITDLRHLMNLLHEFERGDAPAPERLIRKFAETIAQATDTPPKAHEVRLETDADAVTIMTMHGSKGLQFPIVLVPSLWQRTVKPPTENTTYHKETTDGSATILPVGEAFDATAKQVIMRENLEENLRLTYVALTRAELHCGVWYGDLKSGHDVNNPLNYLFSDKEIDTFINTRATAKNKTSAIHICPSVPGVIEVREFTKDQEVATNAHIPKTPDDAFVAQTLPVGFRVPDHWGIMSYTSIGRADSAAHELTDSDHAENDASSDPLSQESGDFSAFAEFLRGRTTGLCIHEIFENLHFNAIQGAEITDQYNRQLIRNTLNAYNLSGINEETDEQRYAMTAEMAAKVATLNYTPQDASIPALQLNASETRTIAEVGFNFPVHGKLDYRMLKALAKLVADESKFRLTTGLITGSIDLIVEHGGKYSFIDWKSDFLGNGSYAAYAPEKIGSAMIESHYLLQFYLYSYALHCYLVQRIRNYDFDTHFGGGFYYFVRGIDGERSDRGLWSRRITREELAMLHTIFGSEATP